MNQLGLNQATLNGSVSRIIAGAALISAAGVLSAAPTRTQYAVPVTFHSSLAVSATGVRNVLGAATLDGASSGSAQWVLATSASAQIVGGGRLSGAYTEAYAQSSLTATGEGTIIRHGAATMAGGSHIDAVALLTVGYAANMVATSSLTADPSIRRNGQTTWERDGYAQVAFTSSFTAEAVRTALAYGYPAGASQLTAEAVKTHGGGAFLDGVLSIIAQASTDSAVFRGESALLANPTVTQFGAAVVASELSIAAEATNTTQGAAEPIAMRGELHGDGRIALRGEASFTGSSNCSATGRLALQGGAHLQGTSAVVGDPVAIRPASIEFACTSDMSADGVVTTFGAAFFVASLSVSVDPITNPTVPAPPVRTMFVPREERGMSVSGEDRTMKVT